MNLLRNHWFDIGGVIAIAVAIHLWTSYPYLPPYESLMWFSLLTLFLHQLEEYRWPGTFPGMINTVIGKSVHPERYPLNSNTALLINVSGWILYFLAALFAEKTIWLGIITIMVSFGNFVVHTFVFNVKAGTFYNAGMATALLLFGPVTILFIKVLFTSSLASLPDIVVGITIGLFLNLLILKTIFWLSNPQSPYTFSTRQLKK